MILSVLRLLPLLFLLTTLLLLAQASIHPAQKRQSLTFSDICGAGAPDCGNGYCCYIGQECIGSVSDPLCRDLIIPEFTQPAVGYSSLMSLMDFSPLTSLGITISTFPFTTLTAATALPTYSDNVIESYSRRTPTTTGGAGVVATGSQMSTAGGVMPTLNIGILVGGMAGMGALIGV